MGDLHKYYSFRVINNQEFLMTLNE